MILMCILSPYLTSVCVPSDWSPSLRMLGNCGVESAGLIMSNDLMTANCAYPDCGISLHQMQSIAAENSGSCHAHA